MSKERKEVELVIFGEFSSLNEYINAERSSRYMAASIKRENTALVAQQMYGVKPILEILGPPYRVSFEWHCANKKKDVDNISFAKKFIFDGLVDAGILEGDGWRIIGGFGGEDFWVDVENPRVVVRFREMDEE